MTRPIKRIHTEETDSTNRLLRDYAGEEGGLMTVATCDYQTAGRGQGNNTWESERGKNLLFSVRVYPASLPANRQYVITEAMALAIRDTLARYTDGISIKWPNDIYWRDMKISGTLSECDICRGCVRSCIVGTGINVNQQRFVSGAPNPVSLRQIIGRDMDRGRLLGRLLADLEAYVGKVNGGCYGHIHSEYLRSLYRRTGVFAYSDSDGEFMASVDTVEPDGRLVLRRESGELVRYGFKEVKFIIDK